MVYDKIKKYVNELDSVLNVTDKQFKEAEELRRELYAADLDTYEIVIEATKKLGMYGVWRGCDSAILVLANSVHEKVM